MYTLASLALYSTASYATIPTCCEPGCSQSAHLLDRVRDRIRFKHYSIHTEQAYFEWIRRFIRFHGKRHPKELGEAEVFLIHPAVTCRVAASPQNQATSDLRFFYREVLETELPWLDGIEDAKLPQRLPVVLSRGEIDTLLSKVSGVSGLVVRLLYGTGMRRMESQHDHDLRSRPEQRRARCA